MNRAHLIPALVQSLEKQESRERFSVSVVITDNDVGQSGRPVVEDLAQRSSLAIRYSTEARRNIALARNESVRHAEGDYIAFIDDDEVADPKWLLEMLQCIERFNCSAILGPVRPYFEEAPPAWIIRGRFCERPEHETGFVVPWSECRTGNVLIRREAVRSLSPAFREEFGTGGEDRDFFMRLAEEGCEFRWCNEAIVYELVPRERWTRRYMFHRALLRGKNVLKHPEHRWRLILTSLVALPVYTLLAPISSLGGQHVFMKYAIRWCDHAGRVLAAIGLNPIESR